MSTSNASSQLQASPALAAASDSSSPSSPSFHSVVRARHSVRSFLPTPVPEATLRSVLADAQLSPSNCNTQPCQVHIVSGAMRDALSAAMLEDDAAGRLTPDFSFSLDDYHGVYKDRSKAQGAAYYQAIGVAREAFDERRTASLRNLQFFNAPHVALLFMPTMLGFYADTVRRVLGVDPSLRLLFGISFGVPDPDAPANKYRINKAPIEETVTFHQ